MKNFMRWWDNAELWVAGACALAASLIGFYGLIMRYCFMDPIGWAEEIIIYLITWGSLLPAAQASKITRMSRLTL